MIRQYLFALQYTHTTNQTQSWFPPVYYCASAVAAVSVSVSVSVAAAVAAAAVSIAVAALVP